jgi:hypothetical protein
MELDVSKLAAEGLRLELDGPNGASRRVVVEPAAGVSGRYRSNEAAHGVDASCDGTLLLSEVRWPGDGYELKVSDARLDRAAADLKIERETMATTGQVGARELLIEKLELIGLLPAPVILRKAALERPGLALGDKALALVCKHAVIERVEIHVADLSIVIHGIKLEGVRVRRGQGVWLILADNVRARRLQIQRGDVTFVAEDVEAQTLGVDGKVVRLARIFAPRAHLGAARLASRVTPQTDGDEAPAKLDLSALDGLDGKIDVDLTADATVPFIGRRRATHHFRVAVDSGTINYRQLEHSLSTLEDAVLDFRLRDSDLVLERDIPLMSKVLVSWPLEPREMGLAQRHLVRVARLFDYRVETNGTEDGGEDDGGQPEEESNGFELRELAFDGLDVRLSLAGGNTVALPGGGRLELGRDGSPALDELSVKGVLRHRIGASERTKLSVGAVGVNVALEAIPLWGRTLGVSALTVGSVERGSIRFVGLAPDGADATLKDLELSSLRLTPRP